MRTATVYLDRTARGWRYRVRAGNGEIIATSEGYTRRASAVRAVRANHPDVSSILVLNRAGDLWRTIVR